MLINKTEIIPANLESCHNSVIKFNIPESEQSYISGNGEGCWGYIEDSETYEKYTKGTGEFEVILLNDCWEYPALTYGTVCQVEGRGEDYRPVAKWDWLQENK
jgi:hypothetical protein